MTRAPLVLALIGLCTCSALAGEPPPRRTFKAAPRLWATGVALIVVSTVAATSYTLYQDRAYLPYALGAATWPVDGSIAMSAYNYVGPYVDDGTVSDYHARISGMWAGAALAQAVGLALVITGVLSKPTVERSPVRFSAGASPQGGFAAAILGRF